MSSPLAPSTAALELIRARTAASHQRLEDGLDLLGDGFGEADYPGLLARFLGFYAPLEARLRAARDWGAIGLDAAQREKAASLEADLLARGLTPAAIAALPRCERLPDVSTPARALGAMYVLEGATLGGQLITRHFQARWGLTPETGGAFFGSYGAAVGPRWREFRAALEADLQTDADREAAADAAAQTFERLEDWMKTR